LADQQLLTIEHQYMLKFLIKLLDDCIGHANSSIIAGQCLPATIPAFSASRWRKPGSHRSPR
jgi:hypothetical protein